MVSSKIHVEFTFQTSDITLTYKTQYKHKEHVQGELLSLWCHELILFQK